MNLAIFTAEPADTPAWRLLAAEIEPLFGPMVGQPEFEEALARKIARSQAFCVRSPEGTLTDRLLGGLLWSAHPPRYRIGWLAVAAQARRCGVGRQLVAFALASVVPPAIVEVVTFGADNDAGHPARHLYRTLGFQPAETAPPGPEGGSRQLFRRAINDPELNRDTEIEF